MASFKICVRKRRKDGLWPVYLLLVHNRKPSYIKTDYVVNAEGVTKDGEVRDSYVLKGCMELIERYAARLNRRDIENWDSLQIKRFLTAGHDKCSFSAFAKSFIDKMELVGSVNNAKIYHAAMNSLEKYLYTKDIGFEMLTRENIVAWINHLSTTRRARTLYPTCIRLIFKEAVLASQDPGSVIAPITYNPWNRIEIPASAVPRKRAIPADLCRRFFAFEVPLKSKGAKKAQIGKDVAMLSFCLAAINTVDLYKLRKSDLKDGVLCYCRSKTSSRRKDGAYIEMRVTRQAQELIEKYKSGKDDERLLSFGSTYSSAQSFVTYVDDGIRSVCKMMEMNEDDYLTFYTFRHTWATIAKNDCGASLSEVGFAMNHIQQDSVTRGYIKPDFTPAWKLNEKVVDFIFSQTSEKNQVKEEEKETEKVDIGLTTATLFRVAVFHQGKCLLNYQDIGCGSIGEVIGEAKGRLPDGVPADDVTVKIVNCDNGKVHVYEHQKGKRLQSMTV